MMILPESKISMLMILTAMICFAGVTKAADNSSADALLNELSEIIGQLRDIEEQGVEIKQTRESNRREMDRLQSLTDSLAMEKERVDNLVVEHNAELQAYNSECAGTTLTGQARNRCESRKRELENKAGSLNEDALKLSPRVDEYNAEINAFNAQDNDLARQEEMFYGQSREIVDRIDNIKGRFTSLAAADGDEDFIVDVRTCNSLQGFEDTLTCLRAVWGIVSR